MVCLTVAHAFNPYFLHSSRWSRMFFSHWGEFVRSGELMQRRTPRRTAPGRRSPGTRSGREATAITAIKEEMADVGSHPCCLRIWQVLKKTFVGKLFKRSRPIPPYSLYTERPPDNGKGGVSTCRAVTDSQLTINLNSVSKLRGLKPKCDRRLWELEK
jgi:hypothetical protein